ncbi:ribosome silencing factor [Eubacterium oxidoreducens]|uniref:Ribosomal silencing factor RsfS n=1 Tax=Eubacterium oxidoreducens TaxID=1732 RepID=A0A1G6ALQ8_EUBOX|nr:ribosome silencing factor [Eubacterium oxidoreducens]SDB09354.1 ribosome-associated protein [Eubacterium oxidoreducens]
MECSQEMAKIAYEALQEKKSEDVKVIDIQNISVLADYFIIANGTNPNQLEAMKDAVDEALYKAGYKVKQVEGNRSSTWILLDYEDIIVHIFSKEDRLFYDLERVWSDGEEVDVTTW